MSVLQTGLNCERTVSTMSNIKNQKSGLVEGDIDGFYTRLTRDLEGIKCSKESVETHITGRKVYEDGYVQTMGNVVLHNESNGQKVALDFVFDDKHGFFDALSKDGVDLLWRPPHKTPLPVWTPKTPITKKLQTSIAAAVIDAVKEYSLQNERTAITMKDIRVNLESCEYNADNSTLTTKGTLEYGGQQFNAEFVQYQDETPTVHVRNEDVEFTCHNGVTAEVHNYNSMDYDADAIFKAMSEKADSYQHTTRNGVLGRMAFENKDINEFDVESIDIKPNLEELGEGDLVGHVRVGSVTLEYFADRDATIKSIAPKGFLRESFDSLPGSDNMKTAIADAIYGEVNQYAFQHGQDISKPIIVDVKFEKCEYDPEADILTTSGKMNFDGKQYDVAFKENGGIPAIEITRGDELEISGQRGSGSVEVSFDDATEGKAIVAALDTIFKEAVEKADAYQHTEPDGRLAHLNYVAAVLDYDDINVFDVHKHEGDIGDLIGKVRVDDETLRFTADRDGEVRQLALSGEHLQDPRNFGLTDYVANLVYDAIEESVGEFVRNEEIDKALGIDSTGPDKDRNYDELEI